VGETLARATEHYFRHSEQIDAGIAVAAARAGTNGHAAWRASALMIQRLPETEAETGWASSGGDATERWRRAHVLMGSVRADELTDPGLTPDRLLYRLFHQEGVRVYRPHPLHAGCRCSRERVEVTLKRMSRDAVTEMTVDGIVTVTCQFCNESYVLDAAALEALYAA
jgi:molecular chaperone Hsp33